MGKNVIWRFLIFEWGLTEEKVGAADSSFLGVPVVGAAATLLQSNIANAPHQNLCCIH
jgi:hypothetical protein